MEGRQTDRWIDDQAPVQTWFDVYEIEKQTKLKKKKTNKQTNKKKL